ncbi:uncharacterized protein PAC_15206 [Phialocephala subalpina]|uniref:Cyanovirin-N domain-containing protein n=1 Tax=Phialocephala subalpina TaxID=576137 RepID=A0A1L7XK47_9HELO|nr:uncharacterized protein PAC_15206 [Phialocephala subalpina]
MHFIPIFTTALLVMVIPKALASDGGFAESCMRIDFQGSTLKAVCTQANGGQHYTELDLNGCINNLDGDLYCGGSGFASSCGDCYIVGGTTVLLCECSDVSGNGYAADIELDGCIGNQNGNLAC